MLPGRPGESLEPIEPRHELIHWEDASTDQPPLARQYVHRASAFLSSRNVGLASRLGPSLAIILVAQ